jgi:hypothetical protein
VLSVNVNVPGPVRRRRRRRRRKRSLSSRLLLQNSLSNLDDDAGRQGLCFRKGITLLGDRQFPPKSNQPW